MVERPFASGADSSGATYFRHRSDFKEEIVASNLHEIKAANWGLQYVHYTLHKVRRKVEQKGHNKAW
jgi:hypothetical protein